MSEERVVVFDLRISYGVRYEGEGYVDMPLGRHTFEAKYLPAEVAEQVQAFVQAVEEAKAKGVRR